MENQIKPSVTCQDNSAELNHVVGQQENKKKVKAKFGIKPFAFISGLIDLLLAAAVIYVGVTTMIDLINSLYGIGNEEVNAAMGIFALPVLLFMPLLIIVGAIFATGGILLLTAGILTLMSSFKSDRRNYNRLLTAVAVFEVLIILALILVYSSDPSVNSLILLVLVIIGFIFKIIDIILTKRRLKKYQVAIEEENHNTYTGPNFANLKSLRKNDASSEPASEQNHEENPAPEGEPTEGNADVSDTAEAEKENKNSGVDFSKLKK